MRRLGHERAQQEKSRSGELRRIPQKKISPFEIAAYAVVPCLLLAAGAMPSTALFFMPAVLPMLYLLFRRFGFCFPFCCVGFYGLFSLLFNYDVLTVVYFVFLMFALTGLVVSAQLKPYLLCFAVALIFAVVGAGLGFITVRLAEGKPMSAVAQEYAVAERDDPFIDFLARYHYEHIDIPENIGRIEPGEEGYADAVTEFYSEYLGDEFETYTPYYCVHFGSIIAMLAYFIALEINRRTCSAYDVEASAAAVKNSTHCVGGVRRETTKLTDMRIPRSYLWAMLLPGLIASVLLDFVGGYDALSATVMHVFVTVPPVFAFVTLMAYLASLFNGKARIAAAVVFFLLMAAIVILPMAMFICSIIGLCDIIINIRFWVEFLRTD